MGSICSSPSPTPTQQVQSSTNPATPAGYQSALDQLLARGQDVSNLPYQGYPGQRQAGFTAPQTQAFDATSNAVGAFQPNLANANAATANAGKQFSGADLSPYMNPFQQQVTDLNAQKLIRNFQSSTVPGIDAAATGAGGFGGSRHALLASEAQRNLTDELARQQSQDSYANWQSANQAFNADRSAALGAAGQYGSLAEESQTLPLRSAAALSAIGGQQQQQNQTGLDIGYNDFLQQRDYPRTQTNYLQGIVSGFPSPTTSTSNTSTAGSSPLSQVAGAGIAGLGFLGATGAFGSSGYLGKLFGGKAGGPVTRKYASGGRVGGLTSLLEKIVEKHGDLGENSYRHGGGIARFDDGGGVFAGDDYGFSSDLGSYNFGSDLPDLGAPIDVGPNPGSNAPLVEQAPPGTVPAGASSAWGSDTAPPASYYDPGVFGGIARSMGFDKGLWGGPITAADKNNAFFEWPSDDKLAAKGINSAISFIPGVGPVNAVSSLVGGPTGGGMLMQAARDYKAGPNEAGAFNTANGGSFGSSGASKEVAAALESHDSGGTEQSPEGRARELASLVTPSTAALSGPSGLPPGMYDPSQPTPRERLRHSLIEDPLAPETAGYRGEHIYFGREGGKVKKFAEGGEAYLGLPFAPPVRRPTLDKNGKPLFTLADIAEQIQRTRAGAGGRPMQPDEEALLQRNYPVANQVKSSVGPNDGTQYGGLDAIPTPTPKTQSPHGGTPKGIAATPGANVQLQDPRLEAYLNGEGNQPANPARSDQTVYGDTGVDGSPMPKSTGSQEDFWSRMSLPIIMAGAKMAEAPRGQSFLQNVGSGIIGGATEYTAEKNQARQDRLAKVEEQKAKTGEDAAKNEAVYRKAMSDVAAREVALKEMPEGSVQRKKALAEIDELTARGQYYSSRPDQVEAVANIRGRYAEEIAQIRADQSGENSDAGRWRNALSEANKRATARETASLGRIQVPHAEVLQMANDFYNAGKSGPGGAIPSSDNKPNPLGLHLPSRQ